MLPWASEDPLVLCGPCEPNLQNLRLVAYTFAGCHAVKNSFFKDFESNAVASSDKHWIFFAQSLSAEAVERRLTDVQTVFWNWGAVWMRINTL